MGIFLNYNRNIRELAIRDYYPIKRACDADILDQKQKSPHDRQSTGAHPEPGDL